MAEELQNSIVAAEAVNEMQADGALRINAVEAQTKPSLSPTEEKECCQKVEDGMEKELLGSSSDSDSDSVSDSASDSADSASDSASDSADSASDSASDSADSNSASDSQSDSDSASESSKSSSKAFKHQLAEMIKRELGKVIQKAVDRIQYEFSSSGSDMVSNDNSGSKAHHLKSKESSEAVQSEAKKQQVPDNWEEVKEKEMLEIPEEKIKATRAASQHPRRHEQYSSK